MKKELKCPNCSKKIASIKILTDGVFRCTKCKMNISVNTTNIPEREKNFKACKMLIRIIWIMFAINMASLFFNLQTMPNAQLWFVAQWFIWLMLFGYIFYLVKKRKELFENNEIKILTQKQSAK